MNTHLIFRARDSVTHPVMKRQNTGNIQQPSKHILFVFTAYVFLVGFMSKLKNFPEISYSEESLNFSHVVYSCTTGEWNRQFSLCMY